jgi:hypothetical protein
MCGHSNLKYYFVAIPYTRGSRQTNMCSCGMSRAYPEFYFTEEDIKKFVGRLKDAIKRLFALSPSDLTRKEEVWPDHL